MNKSTYQEDVKYENPCEDEEMIKPNHQKVLIVNNASLHQQEEENVIDYLEVMMIKTCREDNESHMYENPHHEEVMMTKTNGEDSESHLYENTYQKVMTRTNGEDSESHLYKNPLQNDGSANMNENTCHEPALFWRTWRE